MPSALPRRLALALAVALAAALAVAPASARGASEQWFTVQFDGPITAADHAALRATGAKALQYVPTHAYLAFGSRAEQAAAADLGSVTRVRAVALAQKIDPAVRNAAGVLRLNVVGHPGALDAGALDALGTLVARYDIGAGSPLGGVEINAAAAAVPALADLPGVLYVGAGTVGLRAEDEGSGQVLAGNASGAVAPSPGYEQFLADRGLTGEGVTISITDDGIDATHPEFAGRVAKRYSYGPENDVVPAEGHGTHVAGIVGGKGAELPGIGRVKDANGLLYGLGIAPKVTFVDQPVIQLATSFTSFPPEGGFPQLSKDALDAGAVAWNASWTDGGGTGVGYVANAAVMDGMVRDGDQTKDGSQPFSLIFSAGNSGPNESTMTSPKEAKNIVSVASSRSHRIGNVDMISSFSSRGPAKDGRIVPTVSAPGETVMSARAATGVLCTAPLSGIADAPPRDGYTLYTGCSGTSMASPQVAGAVALIHQWWRAAHDGAEPSPALVKSLLVNSAQDIRRADIPNKDEGWGRVNLANLFDDTASRVIIDQSVLLDGVGASHALQVEPVDPSRPMRATLAWTDAPGAPQAAPALVNDLDLSLSAGDGTVYRGNNFEVGESVAGGQADRLNNLENVYLTAPSGGYTLTVSAANLPGDGVPNNGSVTDQDFALVLTNARIVP